tara:strand:+ start:401 stop:514 length:114 start_codon:yes stop_codon:yes gene_type:complete
MEHFLVVVEVPIVELVVVLVVLAVVVLVDLHLLTQVQ